MVLSHLSNIVKEVGIQLGYWGQDMNGDLDNHKIISNFKVILSLGIRYREDYHGNI